MYNKSYNSVTYILRFLKKALIKRYCNAVLQSAAKGLHGLMNRVRPSKRLHTAPLNVQPGKRNRYDAKPVNESRAVRHKYSVWKIRIAFIAAGAAAIVLTVI